MAQDTDWTVVTTVNHGLNHGGFMLTGSNRQDLVGIRIEFRGVNHSIEIQAEQVGLQLRESLRESCDPVVAVVKVVNDPHMAGLMIARRYSQTAIMFSGWPFQPP